MTSKTLSINLFNGELKRKLWLYIVSLLLIILTGPMALLIRIDNLLIWSAGYSKSQLIREIVPSLSNSNELTMVVVIMIAFLYASASFRYLYNRSSVDLYHSLAIDRKHLFATFLYTAIFPALGLFIIDTVLKIGVLAVKNLINAYIISVALSTFVYEYIYFLLIFMIVLIAMFITGRLYVGFAAAIGLVMLPPVTIENTLSSYLHYCFQSYQGVNLGDGLLKFALSPVTQFNSYARIIADAPVKLVISLIEVALLAVLAYYLYSIRPSECTHQALCYKFLGPVISIPAVILAALCGGIYVVYVSANLPAKWYLAAFIGVGLVTHILLNSIIQGDFRKSLKNWPQLIGSLVAAGIIAAFFLYDLSGFDTYIPDKDKIESVGVVFESVDSSIGNYDIVDNGDGYSLEYKYYVDYRLSHMESKDIDSVYDLAVIGVDNLDKTKSVFQRHLPETETATDGSHGVDDVTEDNKGYYIVKFKLKSGRTVVRNYQAKIDDIKPMLEKVYNSKEYKDSICQLDEYVQKKTISKISGTDRFFEECFALSGDQALGLIEAVKADYYDMTLDILEKEDPVVSFTAYDDQNYYTDGLSGYYIYPSSKNSLSYLSSLGIDINTERNVFDPSRIQSIEVEKYYDNGSSRKTYSPEADRDIVEAIRSVMVIDSFTYDNSALKNYDYNINITCNYLTDSGYLRSFSVRVPRGSLPQKVLDDVSEDKAQW